MEINFNSAGDVGVIHVKGELDALSSSELTGFLSDGVKDNYVNLVLDLQELKYSSSAGIRVFLGMAREARQKGGDIRIAAVQPAVEKIFKLSKFDKIVRIFPEVDDAVNSYTKV